MAKALEIKQTRFDGGIVNDPRSSRLYACRMCTNFDIFTDANRLIPYRDSVSGDSAANTSQKQNFVVALWGPTGTYRLFSLGVVSGTGKAEILMKSISTGSSNDLSDSGWATPNANQSSSGATEFELFVYYKTVGKIFGARAGTNIWAFTPDGSTAFADTSHALSYTTIAQGLVHKKDDCLYIPYDNKIARNNAGSWNDTALTLPADLKIVSIEEDGNYLSIACVPVSGYGESTVFRWDRDSSLTTITERVTYGTDALKLIGKLGSDLIGISLGTFSTKSRVTFTYYTADGPIPFLTLIGESATTTLLSRKQKADGRLYFMMSIKLNGVVREGLWSVGLSTAPGQKFSIAHERTPNNDTALSSGSLLGFFVISDFVFQSYVSSATFALSKTNSAESYTATSIYETLIFNNGDSSQTKKLLGGTIMTEPLPSGAAVQMSYKKDAQTSFTEFLLHDDDDALSHSAVTNENDDTNLPEEKEIGLRLESIGGAVITGFSIEPDFIDSREY